MDLPLDDPWLNLQLQLVLFGGVATWIYFFGRWRRYGQILTWEPRSPVPWGPPAAILAVLFALMALSSALGPGGADDAAPDQSANDIAVQIVSLMMTQLLLIGGFFAVICVVYGATDRDLGLPRTAGQGLRDVGIGIVLCLAALLPVRIVQGLMLQLMGRKDELSQHPLIETLTRGDGIDASVMILACLSTVVVAPICEEITFRLLLQGWLEKWEDRMIGRISEPSTSIADSDVARTSPTENDEARMTNDGMTNDETSTDDDSSFVLRPSSFDGQSTLATYSPERGAFGWPYGWLPIFISSFLFGIAHFGYGPEPIPLFLFAIFLGYVYQRTHRIIPCIVAHAFFNLVSMVTLWRILIHAAE
jgi:membrane protease YdiL (CAAX protease family)